VLRSETDPVPEREAAKSMTDTELVTKKLAELKEV
jgi:hypothetical protein